MARGGLLSYTFAPATTSQIPNIIEPRKKHNPPKSKHTSTTKPRTATSRIKQEPRPSSLHVEIEPEAGEEALNAASILISLQEESQEAETAEAQAKRDFAAKYGGRMPLPISATRSTLHQTGPELRRESLVSDEKTNNVTVNDNAHPAPAGSGFGPEWSSVTPASFQKHTMAPAPATTTSTPRPTPPRSLHNRKSPTKSFVPLATLTEEDVTYFNNEALVAIHSSPAKSFKVRRQKRRNVIFDEYGASQVGHESDTTELDDDIRGSSGQEARTRRTRDTQTKHKFTELLARDVPIADATLKKAQLSLSRDLIASLEQRHHISPLLPRKSRKARPVETPAIPILPRPRALGTATSPIQLDSSPSRTPRTPQATFSPPRMSQHSLSPRAKKYLEKHHSPSRSPERRLIETPPRSRAANQVPGTPSSALLLAAQYAGDKATPGLGEYLVSTRRQYQDRRTPSLESLLGRAAEGYAGTNERDVRHEMVVEESAQMNMEVKTYGQDVDIRHEGMAEELREVGSSRKAREMSRTMQNMMDNMDVVNVESAVDNEDAEMDMEDGEIEEDSEAETVVLTPAWQRSQQVKDLNY